MQQDNRIKIYERITCLEENFKYIKAELDYIKRQVDNHIPSQIMALDDKMDKIIRGKQKQFISILISVILLLFGALLSLIKFNVL